MISASKGSKTSLTPDLEGLALHFLVATRAAARDGPEDRKTGGEKT